MAAAAMAATVACGQTDAGITTDVKAQLAADDAVRAYEVDVETENRVVTLSGDVDTAEAKTRAIAIARNTEGVTDVIDRIRVDETAATSGTEDDLGLDTPEIDAPDLDLPGGDGR